MPDVLSIAAIVTAVALLVGVPFGWILRSGRGRAEKAAITEGWQAQMDAMRSEHRRLSDQNKRLMEQVSQLQATSRESGTQARELASALEDAVARRDDLQHDIKVVRNNLDNFVTEKHRLKSEELEQKEARIEKLKRELKNWQNRLPPLIDRYRERNDEAERLANELGLAEERIAGLEEMLNSDETRVGPLAAEELLESVDASNEWLDGGDADYDIESEILPLETGEPYSDPVMVGESIDATKPDDAAQDSDVADRDEPIPNPEDALVDQAPDFGETNAALFEVHDRVESSSNDDSSEADYETDADILPIDAGQVDRATASGDEFDTTDVGESRETNGKRFEGGLRDDLKAIKGIGPAIEKTLNELGMFRYAQVAAMSTYDIERIANRLKGFRSRIEREDWIGQARSLSEQKAVAVESGGEY